MKIVTGVLLGALSGFLLYLMTAFLLMDFSRPQQRPSASIVLVFLAGWLFSSLLLINGAQTVTKVLARGFLLGAAEWLMMIFVGFVFTGSATSQAMNIAQGADSARAGTMIGGGIASLVMGGFSFFMVLVCLAAFAIVHFMKREMRPERETPAQ
jgi:hypothetical protein